MNNISIESQVVVAIATYKQDQSTIDLLSNIYKSEAKWVKVIVIDSLGSGKIESAIKYFGWSVLYNNSQHNLGSAGNLHRRLMMAAKCLDAKWCYCVNHDGEIKSETIRNLVKCAEKHQENSDTKVGAVYPARFRPRRGKNAWDGSGKTRSSIGFIRNSPPKKGTEEKIVWASSNGALYSLDAIRNGINVWPDLWMGWEDLGFGRLLDENNYLQIRCNNAIFIDNYEYRKVRIGPIEFFISDKPSWYAYYNTRNLLLVHQRTKTKISEYIIVFLMIFREYLLTILFRDEKIIRLKLLKKGIRDAVNKISGNKLFL